MTPAHAIVRAGLGSYLVGPPADAEPPTREIFRGEHLRGPTPSSAWWSSAVWEPFSHPLYPLPLALLASESGLAVGAPDVSVGVDEQFTSRSVLAPFRPDMTLAVGTVTYTDARVDRYGDFDVSLRWAHETHGFAATAAHGSPYVYIQVDHPEGARVTLHGPARVWHRAGAALGVAVNGHPYALFGPTGSDWQVHGTHCVNRLAGKRYWSMALLPEESAEALQEFLASAHAHVRESRVGWRYAAKATVHATHEVDLDVKEGKPNTILALFPHQWRHLEAGYTTLGWSYATVRGEMRVIRGSRFGTEQRAVGLLTHLPALGNETAELAELVAQVRDEGDHHLAHLYPHAERDMYWTGVSLGRAAALVPYAERVGDKEAIDQLVGWLKATLEEHFTASLPDGTPKPTGFFWYDPAWGTMIGHPGGFGADVALNDHHYQYGYWIRAAVEVARHDPDWIRPDRWGAMVDLLVRDIASITADDLFSRLRHFDLYAGHSWATGRNDFADGANAESVSESIAASAAVTLWGERTGNQELRDVGVFLYTTEIYAAQEYWFDIHRENLPAEFGLAMVGQVWGGKSSYSTWWTDDPEAMRGISLLPLTPASFFLGSDVDYVRRNLADLRRLRSTWSYWPDIFWCYEALADPDRALELRRTHGDYTMGHSESHPHTLGWLLDLQTLGHVDSVFTGDSPLCVVFRRDRTRTYLASNPTSAERLVRFADGAELRVPPNTTAITTTELDPA